MDTCKAVEGFPEPRTITDVRSFLGLCNVLRRFVKDFGRIAAPLNAMLKKDRPTTFDDITDNEREVFLELKKRLVSPPVLALPRPNGRYVLDTDACEYQVG